jgi:branched-chain amino acid transport system ATP-binding protein
VTAAIECHGLFKQYGALEVTRDVTLALEPGARHALIGPNGAGKTTLVNLLGGSLRPDAGHVHLHGADVTALDEAGRTRAGLVRTFQINQLFRPLSVLENVMLALAERHGVARRLWRPLGAHTALADEGISILDGLSLTEDASRPVAELAYGRQRLVEIAIAIALQPRVLLLDEPAAGVAAEDSDRVLGAVSALGDDIAVLIIEHDMDVVFRFASEISVLVDGALLMTGTPDEVASDERVRAVYLGQSHGA